MFRNYIKIAVRNLLRNKFFSAINILGLAIGIATCLLILLFVSDELNYDRFYKNANQIYRVVFRGVMAGEQMKEASVMAPVGSALHRDFPEVLDATRLLNNGVQKTVVEHKVFREENFAYVDSNFFQIFSLAFLNGDPKTALKDPNSVVITQSVSKKYFGTQDPIGKSIDLKDMVQIFRVKGVIKDIPVNSHFHFDIFGSMSSVPASKSESWLDGAYFTYILLQKGYDYKRLEAKLPSEFDKYAGPQLERAMGMNIHEFQQKGNKLGLYLQPLTDIHLKSDFVNSLEPDGDIRYIYIFSAIAVFMLLIACINFMNLSTAGASRRAMEVGIRKVLGSFKTELIQQFLIESALLSFLSLALAFFLVAVSLPAFNQLSGKNLPLDLLWHPAFLFKLLIIGLVVSLLAGSYPAFYLSAFNPVTVLKSKFIPKGNKVSLRSLLVIFQFTISVILIIGTLVVYKQLSYIRNIKLGYDKEHLLVLRNSYLLGNNETSFRHDLEKDPRIVNITTSAFVPAGPTNSDLTSSFPDSNINNVSRVRIYQVDYDYIPTLGMKLSEGRNFSRDFPTDSSSTSPCVIVNQTLANVFGWGDHAIGHQVKVFTNNTGGTMGLRVIGVVEDFHFKSLHEKINPLMMVLQNSPGLIMRIKTRDLSGLLTHIKTIWNQYQPEEPFTYAFLDQLYNQTYQSEEKTGTILDLFAGLTIFIACMGLLGLAIYTTEQRTKEIGIRKVMGASAAQVVGMLSREFLLWVMISCLIAFPLAYWAMKEWLRNFAYQIQISWWIFIMAALGAFIITLITISFQAIKAAVSNPVKSLRSE